MKRFAILAILLSAPLANAANCFAHVSTHGTVTSASMNTTGATILVAVMSSFSGFNEVLTDSVGNRDWQTAQEYDQLGNGGGPFGIILYKPNPATSTTYTFSIPPTSGLFFMSATVWACSGTTTDHPLAQQVGLNTSGAATTWQPGSVTPIESGDLIFAIGTANTSTATATIDSGFATPAVNNTSGFMSSISSWLSAPNTSPVNPTWTTNFAPWVGSIAVFKATGATPPPDTGQHINTPVGNGLTGTITSTTLGVNAPLNFPGEIVKTSNGLICFTDINNNHVLCYNPTGGTLVAPWVGSVSIPSLNVAIVAGSNIGFVYNVPPLSAKMAHPVGLTIDSSDCLYIADQQNSRILQMCPGGNLIVIAGGDNGGGINSGCRTAGASDDFSAGYIDGVLATSALLSCPQGVTIDPTFSYLVVTDGTNYRHRVINLTASTQTYFGQTVCAHCIKTIMGQGTRGCTMNATGTTSLVGLNTGSVDFDNSGNLYAPMYDCNAVWKLSTTGVPSLIAGINGTQGYSGDGDLATLATMRYPFTLKRASNGDFRITDTGNSVIRFIDHVTGNISTIAGNFTLYPFYSPTLWNSGGYCCDNGAANIAGIGYPIGIYYDAANSVTYISDLLDSRLRMMFSVGPTGIGSQITRGTQWPQGIQIK